MTMKMRLPADQDTLTLPELLSAVSNEAWSELEGDCPDNRSARQPMISSLRPKPAARAYAAFGRSDFGILE